MTPARRLVRAQIQPSPARRSNSAGRSVIAYLAGLIVLLSGCSAAQPGAAAPSPARPAKAAELERLRAENEALGRRVEELEAERDRLRQKVEPLVEAKASSDCAPAQPGEERERLPSVAGLPVVKLVPNPKASGAEVMEAEEVETRPTLRVYGEEEGALVTGATPHRAKGKS